MTLANWLTALRLLVLGPVVYFTLRGELVAGFVAFALGFLTDILDGYLARTRREITPLGQILDPVADKLLFLGVFVPFAVRGEIPWGGLAGYLIPQLGLGAGALYLYLTRREVMSAEIPGKVAAGTTALAAFALYWTPFGRGIFWGAVGVNVLSALYYLSRLLRAKGGTRAAGGR